MFNPPKIIPADIEFDRGAPRARGFDDVYFNPEDGLAESRHVFLNGIGAPDLWRNKPHTVIAETGFGAGLNFLATWELWRRTARDGQYLHYVSVEGFPLTRDDLARALRPFAELRDMASLLVSAYPLLTPGFHPLHFDHGRVRLTLLFGEAAAALKTLTAAVDAWYLDGFAPDRNGDMWRGEVIAEIARLSKPQTRLASFTVAGEVRRALLKHGFTVEKAPGFGKKRECLRAVFTGPAPQARESAPWYAPPPPISGGTVAVIGGGIAGLMTATALQTLGLTVTLYEARESVAAAASGNPAAVVEPWLDRSLDAAARAHISAYGFALHRYKSFAADIWRPCGVMRLLTDVRAWNHAKAIVNDQLLPHNHAVCVDPADAAMIAGIPVSHPALHLPQAGMLQPPALAKHLSASLDIRASAVIKALQPCDAGWRLLGADHELLATADAVVLTAALDTARLAPLPFTFEARAGDITYLPPVAGLEFLQTVVTYGGYVTPAVPAAGGVRHIVGATFDVVPPDNPVSLKADGHSRNLRALQAVLPHLALPDPMALTGRTAVRATTSDHMPVMGALPDIDFYEPAYAGLKHGRRGPYPAAQYRNGLYTLSALGSRGFLTAPLLAEALAAQILGLPSPLERPASHAFHPARLWLRRLKKRG